MIYLSHRAACLTKAGFDAGESFQAILARKEMERACGDGVFWWGIGENKGAAIDCLVQKYDTRDILFNFPETKSVVRPDRTEKGEHGGFALVWRSYLHPLTGRVESLPGHTLVTSGAATKSGRQKLSYNALVCRSESSLGCRAPIGHLRERTYRNLSKEGQLGTYRHGSQTTLVLVADATTAAIDSAPDYPVHYVAEFFEPNFVSLRNSKMVPKAEIARLNQLIADGCARGEWLAAIEAIRA